MARRATRTGALLAALLLATVGVDSLSSRALSVPSVGTPAVSTPAVNVPSVSTPPVTVPPVNAPPVNVPPVSTPAGNTPPVSTPPVSTPPVSAPSVSTQSASAPSAGAPAVNVSSGSGASASAPGSQATSLGIGPASGATPSAAGGRGQPANAAASSASRAGSVAGGRGTHAGGGARGLSTRERQLRSLVARLSGCLSVLSPQARRLLVLRTGLGSAPARSGSAVAQLLHVSVLREALLELTALVGLETASREGRCGTAGQGMIGVPASDRLVFFQSSLGGASELASAVTSASRGRVEAFSQNRVVRAGSAAPGSLVLQNAAIAQSLTSSAAAATLVFGGLALLAAFLLLAAVGRRLGARQPLAMSSGAAHAGLAAPAFMPAPVPRAAAAPTTPAQPAAIASPAHEVPAALAPWTAPAGEPAGTAPAGEPQLPVRRSAAEPSWLRSHASEVALVFTVLGGAVRMMARGKGRSHGRARRSSGRRRR